METVYFLGIDISKKTFQSALTLDGVNVHEAEVENTAQAIKSYLQELKGKFKFSFDQLIVCMEHTGIYCLPVLDYLTESKIKVCVEPALQIKQSQGMTRGKSDRVDARRIAQPASCWNPATHQNSAKSLVVCITPIRNWRIRPSPQPGRHSKAGVRQVWKSVSPVP